jgi:hypothetical protein
LEVLAWFLADRAVIWHSGTVRHGSFKNLLGITNQVAFKLIKLEIHVIRAEYLFTKEISIFWDGITVTMESLCKLRWQQSSA